MTEHIEVASYALGLLDLNEMSRFEAHLVDCDDCADQLELLLPSVRQLAEVEPGDLFNINGPSAFGAPIGTDRRPPSTGPIPMRPAAGNPGTGPIPMRSGAPGNPGTGPIPIRPGASGAAGASSTGPATGPSKIIEPQGLRAPKSRRIPLSRPASRRPQVERSPSLTRPPREPHPRRRSILVTSAVAIVGVLVGAGAIAASPWSKSDPVGGTAISQAPRRLSGTDTQTGVHADAVLETKPWGTLVSFGVSDIHGPRSCQLVAVEKNGRSEVLSSWKVPAQGYGPKTRPDELELEAATALDPQDITALRVQQTGDRTTDLVTLKS